MLKLKLFLLPPLVFFLLFIFLVFSKKPAVDDIYTHPIEVKKAVKNYRYISDHLFRMGNNIDIELSKDDLQSIINASSHLTPFFNAQVMLKDKAIQLSTTLDLSRYSDKTYINASCRFKNSSRHLLDHCQIGHIYLPGFVVKNMVSLSLSLLGQDTLKEIFIQLVTKSHINHESIAIHIEKKSDLKEQIKSDMRKMVSYFDFFKGEKENKIDYAAVVEYLEQLNKDAFLANNHNVSLALVFNKAFDIARARTQKGTKINESAHALFAVAVAYANVKFIEILEADTTGIKPLLASFSMKLAKLDDRHDLALHFLYSAVIEQFSNKEFAFNLGELKELFDVNKGGSNFDFTDLAADIAGARFAHFISSEHGNALSTQRRLVRNHSEALFFPEISTYPRAVNLKALEKMVFSNERQAYSALIDRINRDISVLPLYQ